MFSRVKHSKDTGFGKVRKSEVPFALHVLGTNLVDLFEGIEVCNGDLSRRESNNGSILLVKGVNVKDSLSCYYCTLQTVMCKAGIPRAGQMPCWACKTNVEEL
jgi:hypothetical protein